MSSRETIYERWKRTGIGPEPPRPYVLCSLSVAELRIIEDELGADDPEQSMRVVVGLTLPLYEKGRELGFIKHRIPEFDRLLKEKKRQ